MTKWGVRLQCTAKSSNMYLRPKGYSVVTDGWGVETREDTAKCNHCQKIIFISTRQDPNEFFCRSCMQSICPQCANGPCDHFEKKLDRAEQTDKWLMDRFAEKLERAKSQSELRAIATAMTKEQMLRDMGLA